jgi:hypothetical protein
VVRLLTIEAAATYVYIELVARAQSKDCGYICIYRTRSKSAI